ncbi:MAG: threonylcarbamoyl-AMP synthase [Candidatus Thorarchaeota archaeon]|nr:MAG: threonylcarbamoyl-AMP synthase [Candidatus Thorarchaeota archaeon]
MINVGSSGNPEGAISEAAEILLSGGLVAYPTESFYGLAADAANETAVKRLFLAKKRSPGNPVLLLIPNVEVLDKYIHDTPPAARKLIEKFWPGGLTLVFDAGPKILPLLTAGTGKIGIRLSSHPVATALAQAIGAPITGTSANISGNPPCSSAGEVRRSLGGGVDLILDGGKTKGGVGSTVLDVTVDPPRILRQGMVSQDEIMANIRICHPETG